jgi:hypothetical protein
MPDASDELERLRQELRNLEEAISRREQPLDSYTKGIAEAKLAKLRRRIAMLEGGATSTR